MYQHFTSALDDGASIELSEVSASKQFRHSFYLEVVSLIYILQHQEGLEASQLLHAHTL